MNEEKPAADAVGTATGMTPITHPSAEERNQRALIWVAGALGIIACSGFVVLAVLVS